MTAGHRLADTAAPAPEGRHRTQRRSRRALVLALGLTVASGLAGCGLDQSRISGPARPADPTTAPDRRPPTTNPEPSPGDPDAERPAAPALDWWTCGDLDCATATVPLDHDDPTGPTVEVDVVRHRARQPDQRIGPLFMNPGGPGGSATDFVGAFVDALPDQVVDRFDIVGVDPRGVGGSHPLDCDTLVVELYSLDMTIDDESDRRALLETSQRFVDECETAGTDVLANVGTRTVARDMDLIRQALGDEQLSYLGISYGTVLGQVYAAMFAPHVRAMVLDAPVDLTESAVDAALGQAEGFELALTMFVRDCRADDDCPAGDDPMAVLRRVEAAAEEAPIPAPRANRAAGPGEVTMAVVSAMYSPSRWPDLARALADADPAGGDPDGSRLVALADLYVSNVGFDVFFAVSCIDMEWPGVDELLARAEETSATHPNFGEALLADYVRCSLWPVPPDPLEPPAVDELVEVLVIGTTNDPATPYRWAESVAGQLPGAHLLTREGDGHGAVGRANRCIDSALEAYLVDLAAPEPPARCG